MDPPVSARVATARLALIPPRSIYQPVCNSWSRFDLLEHLLKSLIFDFLHESPDYQTFGIGRRGLGYDMGMDMWNTLRNLRLATVLKSLGLRDLLTWCATFPLF